MRSITVALGDRAYPIYIGSGLGGRADLLVPHLKQRRVMVVTNTTVAPLYLEKMTEALRANGVSVHTVILPDGEQYKHWGTLNQIFDALIANRCERETTLIALGGGVVGDMGGFAAACYQRGMPFIQVPTTLLAQVDSSIGGKTAINHPLGKNMIGAFYQPQMVLADVSTLDTLDDRQLRAGISEIIKIALIRDAGFLEWMEGHIKQLLRRDQEALVYAVERACMNKAEVVVADEFEHGERALLNLGHTFGHAIEAGMGYGKWLHGEAVAAGTMMAAELSCRLGWITKETVRRLEALYLVAGLPVEGPPELSAERYLELMQHDKKVQNGKMRLVLLQNPGCGVVSEVADLEAIGEAIQIRTSPGRDQV